MTYTYPNDSQPALHGISLSVDGGEFVLVTGESGSGKSTLLRCLNGLVPHFTGGRISGRVRVAELDPVRVGPSQMSRTVGMVFQDPETQFVVDQVEDEIAFALENAALPRDEMRALVEETMRKLEITNLRNRPIRTLSGGEQQRVAIASALALRPQVLVLDEPTSQLDAESAHEVLDALARLNRELGLTIVLSEHRLERVMPFAHRVIQLDHGSVINEGRPRTDDRRPSSIVNRQSSVLGKARLLVTDLRVVFGQQSILRGVDLQVNAGEIVALMGRNGTGKTTLLKAIVGLVKSAGGRIVVNGKDIAGRDTADICRDAAYLPQNPNALLFAETVADELNLTRANHRLNKLTPSEAEAMLGKLGIARYADSYPRDLSVGERQRVAIGAVSAAHPKLLLLDEPTRGLDATAKRALATSLKQFSAEGVGILLVTHDHNLVDECANRVRELSGGVIVRVNA